MRDDEPRTIQIATASAPAPTRAGATIRFTIGQRLDVRASSLSPSCRLDLPPASPSPPCPPRVSFALAWILGGLVVALVITVAVLSRRLRIARNRASAPIDASDSTPRESEAMAALRVSEARMRESEARFRQLAESIASVFYLTARDGTVLYVSPAYDTVWERSCESRYDAPESFVDAVHPDDRDHVLANHDLIFERAIDIEYRIVMPDGRIKWIHDVACPVRDEAGTVVRAAGSATDITAQRLLEGQLAQSSKLESLGRLAGGIAHDFNNLLTIILSQATLIEESVADAAIRDELRKITAAADRAAVLTKQLLAFARRQVYEPARRRPERGDCDDRADAAPSHRRGHRARHQTLSEPATVRVDPRGVEQVLVNLAVNARDAMPKGGTLTIALGAAAFTQQFDDRHADATPGPCHVRHRHRHRHRHRARAHRSCVRAVLHHQTGRAGHRPRAGDGVRVRAAIGRTRQAVEHRRTRHQGVDLPASRLAAPAAAARQRIGRSARAVCRRSCSSRTKRAFAMSRRACSAARGIACSRRPMASRHSSWTRCSAPASTSSSPMS